VRRDEPIAEAASFDRAATLIPIAAE